MHRPILSLCRSQSPTDAKHRSARPVFIRTERLVVHIVILTQHRRRRLLQVLRTLVTHSTVYYIMKGGGTYSILLYILSLDGSVDWSKTWMTRCFMDTTQDIIHHFGLQGESNPSFEGGMEAKRNVVLPLFQDHMVVSRMWHQTGSVTSSNSDKT